MLQMYSVGTPMSGTLAVMPAAHPAARYQFDAAVSAPGSRIRSIGVGVAAVQTGTHKRGAQEASTAGKQEPFRQPRDLPGQYVRRAQPLKAANHRLGHGARVGCRQHRQRAHLIGM